WLSENKFLPQFFKTVPEKLKNLLVALDSENQTENEHDFFISGGTDLLVQKPELVGKSVVRTASHHPELKGIKADVQKITIGGGTTVEEMRQHPEIQSIFPDLYAHL